MEYQSNIDRFHTFLNNTLATLLENQIKTRTFISEAQQYSNQISKSKMNLFGGDRLDNEALSRSNSMLLTLGEQGGKQSIQQIKSLLVECDRLVKQLHRAMIDRELYEQQGIVLQSIILSHDKIEHWEEFVMTILRQFHAIFEFNFFSIAFNSQHGIDLYLYYMGEFPHQIKEEARKKISAQVSSKLSNSKLLTVKDYQVFDTKLENINIDQMHLVTIDVNKDIENLGGLLEMGYFSSAPLGIDEESIIKSILSVMVMVIGSSRTLKKTLTNLENDATQDPLTGLNNRRYFNDALKKEIERSNRNNHEFCILMLDLDNFKSINDSYGHLCGDNVLQGVAKILKNNLRQVDSSTRMGGDEFIVILPETPLSDAHQVAEGIKNTIFSHSFSDQNQFKVTTSIGIVSFTANSASMEELLTNVDVALYQAKARGRNTVCNYDPADDVAKNFKKHFGLTQDLKLALSEERIIPYFQPIVSTSDKSIFAYEALARIKDKNGEVVSISPYLEASGRSDVINELDKYMLQKITHLLHNQFGASKNYPLVFINLSPASLLNKNILNYASTQCSEKGIPHERIVFEMTERDPINDMSSLKQFVEQLREKGFGFALDDFGSGYNSFSYLRELQFDYLKIDGEFVKNILNSETDLALVETLQSLSKKLNLQTIAEYVESEEILYKLKALGITYCQGFYTGLPCPVLKW